MEAFYITTHLVLSALLFIVIGIRPARSNMSRFELDRRAKIGDKVAKKALAREEKLHDITSLQRIASLLIITAVSFISISAYGFEWGLTTSIIIALFAGAVSKLWPFKQIAHFVYARLEQVTIQLIDKFPRTFRLIRGVSLTEQEHGLNSKEELIHLIAQSGEVLTSNEKRLIQNGLVFDGTLVGEIMIPKSKLETIKKSEILGPVVLNDLHNMGHSHLPVVDGGGRIVGILDVQDLLVLSGDSRSSTVEKVMNRSVHKIASSDKLDYAIAEFLRHKRHVFIVENRAKEIEGMLTLKDVIDTLFGRKISHEHS